MPEASSGFSVTACVQVCDRRIGVAPVEVGQAAAAPGFFVLRAELDHLGIVRNRAGVVAASVAQEGAVAMGLRAGRG